jgi:hypothetical protein
MPATSNAFEFAINLEKIGEQLIDKALTETVKKISMMALRGVVLKSPVDTGRFRGNWNVSIGAADWSTTEEVDKDGSDTLMKGNAVIRSIPEYKVIWICNGLPYARALETGWSKQAPAGMVALTVAEIESTLV